MAGVTLSGKAITGLLALATLMVFAGLALWLAPLQPGIVALQLAFTHLPVMQGDAMVGLISIGDVVKARLSELAMEKDALEGMIKGF